MRYRMLKLAVLAIVLVTASACSTTTMRTHPTLAQELLDVERVVVAPPEVEVLFVTFTGENERMSETELNLSGELLGLAENRLTESGYEVVDFDFDAAREEDEELASSIGEFRARFEQAKKDLRAGQMISESEASSVQASLGEAATEVAARADADAVLIIRYVGFDKSGGQVAKDVGTSLLVGVLTLGAVVPISPTSGGMTEIALIDGITGDVLWTDIRRGALSSDIAVHAMGTLPEDIDPETDTLPESDAH